jgi:hypothetical protein
VSRSSTGTLVAAATGLRNTAVTARALANYAETCAVMLERSAEQLAAAGGSISSTDEPGAMQEQIDLAEKFLGTTKGA